jgi:bifunctional non-homologous end joining protein LigD
VVSLAQMGIVDVHTWNSTDDDVEWPNRIVWDLDPGPDVAWKDAVAAAKVVRDVLTALELESWVKTTGGRGLHVVMPIKPTRDWSTSVCAFSPRARPGAMLSMPLEWRESGGGRDRWTLLAVPQRLKRLKTDPWSGYWTTSQRLSNPTINAMARLCMDGGRNCDSVSRDPTSMWSRV